MSALSPARFLKQALAGRQRLLVVNIDYSNASLVEFLARHLADVVFIDCEQGDTSIETIPDLVRAAHLAQTPIVVRLPDAAPSTIERYLFRGIDGIVVPRLDTPDQIQAVVDTVIYCSGARASDHSIVVQIETAEALRNIDSILAVEGIDALFIGPVDLSRSLGFAGDFQVAEVRKRIDWLIARIAEQDRAVGMLVDEATIATFADKGVTFLYLHTNDFLLHGKGPFLHCKEGMIK